MIDRTSLANGTDDGGEVVVGQHHGGCFLRHLGTGDAHCNAHVRLLECGCIVHAVAGHRNNATLRLKKADESHLVFGGHACKHTDLVDLIAQFVVGHAFDVGASDGATGDAQLLADACGGDGMVARDHLHRDPGLLCFGDGEARFGPWWIDDADQ